MGSLTFKLEKFEGPLDLLLYLITKHKLDIYDIEITLLLDQYLEYIDSLEEQDFDAAGDFLAMAARLVYIKTCSLLPQAEEAEEMKKELQGELIEYSACKEAAARLREISVYGDVFVRPPEKLPVNKVFTGNIDPQRLVDAYMGMSAKSRSMKPVRAEQFSPIVAARIVTVTSKIVHVLKKLHRCGECSVEELYEDVTDKSARVATFLAVLELAKSGRIYLNDENTMIYFNRESPRRHSAKDRVGTDNAESEVRKEPEEKEEFQVESKEVQDDIEEIIEDEILEESEFSDNSENFVPAKNTEIANAGSVALEMSSRSYSLAVPVYAPSAVVIGDKLLSQMTESAPQCPPAREEIQAAQVVQISQICEQPPTDENLPQIAHEISSAETAAPRRKENRFSLRYRWRTAAAVKNCWIYRRERV